jgi:hypothetical protein
MQQKVERRDATSDVLLKHSDTTVALYVLRQLKHLKHASETLKKHLKTIATIFKHPNKNTCNVCMKYVQHPDKHTCNMHSENTDETYV